MAAAKIDGHMATATAVTWPRPPKVHENRVRRMAGRQELRLSRSRRRDPLATDYGLYTVTDATGTVIVVQSKNLGYVEWVLQKRGVVAAGARLCP